MPTIDQPTVRVERRDDPNSPVGYWCPSCQYAGRGYSTGAPAEYDAGRHTCGQPKWNERYEPRDAQ